MNELADARARTARGSAPRLRPAIPSSPGRRLRVGPPSGWVRVRAPALMALLGLGALFAPVSAAAQVEAAAVLKGTAFVGDTVMADGIVVLHRLSENTQGEVDSLSIAGDGTFTFRLPNVPDPSRNDMFFASVRHHGVLYFGPAITSAVQLDSIYEIHAYDTLLAPASGFSIALQSRSIFFEPDSAGWRVTDLFQVRNDEPRTIVARPGGRVWSHPLPGEARNVRAGEGELAFDAAQYEDGDLVVRAALPPGERLFVVRYEVDSPVLSIPNAGTAESLDVLVREPAPPIEVEGLELVDRIELEAGSTYLRFSGVEVSAPMVRVVETEEPSPPPVEWIAVLLALVLAGVAVFVMRPGRAPAPEPAGPVSRSALVRQVALLDEDFDAEGASEEERLAYERRRAELVGRIRSLDG